MIQNSQYYQIKSIQIKPIVHLYSNLVIKRILILPHQANTY